MRHLSTILVVFWLSVVGFVGHTTHWTFQWHADEAHSSADQQAVGATSNHKSSHAPQTSQLDDGRYQVEFSSPEAVERTGIQSTQVTTRPLAMEVVGTGAISYDERLVAQLSPRVAGSVWRVEKHLGDAVHNGEVMAIVESEAVGKLKADFLNSLVTLDSLEEVLRSLVAVKEAIPGSQLREVKSDIREAKIRLLNAEQSLVNLGLPLDKADFVNLSDEDRALKVRTLGLPESVLTGVDFSRLSSNLLPLVAPFDGVVISREVVIGEVVDPARHAFEIADNSRMWITLDINKEDITQIAAGQVIHFRPDGLDVELISHVEWLSTELNEQTRTLQIRGPVDNPVVDQRNRLLRAHTYGTGRIIVRRNETAKVIPRDCLQWDGHDYVIFVQESPTRFIGQKIEIGLKASDYVEILDALPEGTSIARSGSHMLKAQWQFSKLDTVSK